jgi:hypothetical protein
MAFSLAEQEAIQEALQQRSDQEALQTGQQDLYSSQRISVKSAISAENYQVEKGATILKYPDKMLDNNTDYVIFGFYKYDPPFGRGQGGDGSLDFDSGNAGYNSYAKSGIGKKRIRGMDPILLYMPEDIQGQYSAKWQGTGFGATTAGLLSAAGTSANIMAGLESLPAVIKNGVFKAELEKINKLTGSSVSLNQFTGAVSGTIINPNTEMTYEAPEMRGFSLQFKMIPNNGVESKTIRKICNRFKKAMLPRFGGQAIFGTVKNAPNLLSIPALCQVNFMSGNGMHPYLPQYKLCAITDVSINYTPDGSYATYGDKAPVATVLKVTFKETKLLFSDEINEDGVSF